MSTKKVFHLDKNKMMLHQKMFCAQKVINFSGTARHMKNVNNFQIAQV